MSALAVVFIAFSSLAVFVWASRHFMINVEKRGGFLLSPRYDGPPLHPPLISVILAAKDEEVNIGPCVRTMLDQDYPNYEMIVCNDRSSDRTREILGEVAAADSRLKIIDIQSLPEGWCGKNNAMQTGIAASRGEWICMIDADTHQSSRRTLSVALQYALDKKADFLSILPQLKMQGFWENVIQPVCGGLMMIWFHPDKVNSPDYPNAYANGAFMFLRRTVYEAIGTHAAVRTELNEDMHLARLAKEKGFTLRVVRGLGLYTCRMYNGCRQTLRGWGRIFFGTFGTLRRLSISLAVLVVMGLVPHASMWLGLALAAAGVEPASLWLAAGLVGLLAVGLQITVIYRFYSLVGARRDLAWTYPIGTVMTMVALCFSLSRLRKGAAVTWRGTSYTSASKP